MPSLNKVLLIGNLTRNPSVKYTPKGVAVAELGLAVNRVWNDADGQKQEEVTFIDITLWGRQAETAARHLTKGRLVYVEGRLHLDTWQDKQSGENRYKLKVVAESWQFLGSKPAESGGEDYQGG